MKTFLVSLLLLSVFLSGRTPAKGSLLPTPENNMTARPTPTTASNIQTTVPAVNPATSLPPLQVITMAKAAKLQLLITLPIPGFQKSSLSQCSVVFSLDGKYLSGVCYRNLNPLWDAKSGQLIRTLIDSISWDGTVRLWGMVKRCRMPILLAG